MKHILYIATVLVFVFILSCTPKKTHHTKSYYADSGIIFNTFLNVKYEASESLADKIYAELEAFGLSLNPFIPNSIVSKVNRNEDVELDLWFTTVFNKSMEVSTVSDGAFDVTVAPLINLWGFGFEHVDRISQYAIDSIKQFVGYHRVHIENNRVIKTDPRIKFNFSAIAKGYACDVIASLLEREGVENYMVDIGREIVAMGKNPDGNCWRVGISKPEDDSTGYIDEIECIVRLCDKIGFATSGNYRNYYIKDGKKISHTIDPHSGYPSEKSILSATVICNDCMTADAYATAFMVMGVEEAVRIAEGIPEIKHYFLIYSDDDSPSGYKIKQSKGMESILNNVGSKNFRE